VLALGTAAAPRAALTAPAAILPRRRAAVHDRRAIAIQETPVRRMPYLGAMLAAFAIPAAAHHSSAGFDYEAEITLEGVVTKFEWANPHVYIYLDGVERESGRRGAWQIEGLPPGVLKPRGWSATSLAAGERVTVTARPPRNRTRTDVLLQSVTKADGTILGRSPGAADGTPPELPKATSLSGTWVTQINETTGRLFDEASLQDPEVWPLTPKGADAVASFREAVDHPGLECVPYTAPWIMLITDTKAIEMRGDALAIRGEFDGAERLVHLNAASHDGAEPSLQGHSIARWEGNALVVDTALFAEHRNGTFWSVPSSPRKHLTERLELDADGTGLTYRFQLEDPEYLTRPVTAEARWIYRPDIAYHAEPCDVDNARRFVRE
jgi:hypothetical protein